MFRRSTAPSSATRRGRPTKPGRPIIDFGSNTDDSEKRTIAEFFSSIDEGL
jgi:hypothetical protein